MALIFCPECGKEVSNKATNCIHCGCPLSGDDLNETKQKVKVESGNVKGNTLKKFLIAFVIIITVVLGALFVNNVVQEKAEAERIEAENKRLSEIRTMYIANINLVIDSMFEGAIESESVSNLISKIWYNTIYEERDYQTDKYTREKTSSGSITFWVEDFNDAINNYMSSSDYTTSYNLISQNEDTVRSYMKKVQTPPEGMENAYNTLTDLHSAYLKMTSNATNPQGNLSSYNESCNEASKEFINLYEKIEAQIPEE